MPAKKKQKAKTPAKIKKTTAKKIVVAKTKPTKAVAVKKAVKKVAPKKAVNKVTPKKVAKKVVKKAAPKKVNKTAAKKEPKKIKKAPKAEVKKAKKVKKTKELKSAKTEKRESLAKTILAKHSSKTGLNPDGTPVNPEENIHIPIIVRRYESKIRITFKIGEYAVYPSHGIGKIIDIEKTTIGDQEFKCYLMHFEKERLTIKIPMASAYRIGIRGLISKKEMDEVFIILRSGIKKLKGMWSRRAQEYETKINSGDIMLLAEVLRDLTRDIEDSERSYSERIIYETAIHRLATEYSVIYAMDFEEAKEKIIMIAKDKLGSEPRINQKDEFDDFDDFDKEDSKNDDDEDEDDEDEDEDED
jgi:CarD family transcriptional regulator